jgi:rhamnulokinase
MAGPPATAQVPEDKRALIAVDLGAESCRVSLLRWQRGKAEITLAHRFANAPRQTAEGLCWDIVAIEAGVKTGLRHCAAIAHEGIRSIAIDGWAVDYVRLDEAGAAIQDPFCYRDERTISAELDLHRRISPERLRELTGVQLLRINTLYQLFADQQHTTSAAQPWLNLPEYLLYRLGAARVSELTNASHTQLIGLHSRSWCDEIFTEAQLHRASAAEIVSPGTIVGKLGGELATLPAFRDTVLIAPACHDTASAIAGIPAQGDDWAYISAGTWSLVGTLLEQPRNGPQVCADNFTNLYAVGNRICFHKNVNGMWMLRQCMNAWSALGKDFTVQELVAAAEQLPSPSSLLDVDHPDFLLAGHMLESINVHLLRSGSEPLDPAPENAPAFASLIFHSLAARYAQVLERVEFHTGRRLKRLYIVGGASQNEFLNRLTQAATGLEVIRGSAESSTLGNFAIQAAVLEPRAISVSGVSAEEVAAWADLLWTSSSPRPT